jgi:hypothetical protein
MGFAMSALRLPMAWDAIHLESRKGKPIRPALAMCGNGIGVYACAWMSAGAAGWMYSRAGAARVIKSFEHFRHAIDTHLGFFWRHGLLALRADPPLVRQSDAPSVTGNRPFSERDLTASQWIKWRAERIEHECRKWFAAYLILARIGLLRRESHAKKAS